MKLIFLCLFGLFFSVNALFSQVMIPVQITTKNALTDAKEGGIVLKVYDGTTIVKTISSDANGLIKFTIPGGKKYRVVFSKAGKVGRFMLWDFKNVVDEVISGNVIPMMESPLSLFEEVPGVDFSFFKTNPVTEFYYDPSIDKEKMANDVVKSQKTIKKQESLKKEIENLKGQSNAQYNALIKAAQGLEKQEKYAEAIAKYEKASELDKKATLPAEKIAELELIMKAQKGNNATNAQLEQDYKNLVASANTLRDQGKAEEALDKYEAAYKLKKEQYVLDEIDKCEATLKAQKSLGANKVKYDLAMKQGDGFVTQKSWEAAKAKYSEALQAIPNDPAAAAKLADVTKKSTQQKEEQDKLTKFNTAMIAGDAFFTQNKFDEAKAKYEDALIHQPGNADATKKKQDCINKTVELQKEKERQVAIDKLITDGNKAMSESQWLVAKNSFLAVQKLDEKNTVAAAKLIAVEAKLTAEKNELDKANKVKLLVAEADALVKTGKLNEAKAKYDAAFELNSDPAVKQKIDAVVKAQNDIAEKEATKKQFDLLIAAGDAAFKAGDLTVAKEKFNAAKLADNSSTIPAQRLADVDKKETALKAEKEKADQYETLFKSGQTALDGNDLALAKTKFEAAYNLDKTKTAAKEKLDFVTKQINDKNAVAAIKAKYDAAFNAGIELQKAGKLTEAKAKFIEAKNVDPSQTAIQDKINEVDGLIAKQNQQKQFDQLIAEGNTALSKSDLTVAKAKFDAAQKVDPTNTLAKEGLEKVAKKEAELVEKEQQLKEQQLKEQQLKEQQLNEQQLNEQQQKVLVDKGEEAEKNKQFELALNNYEAADKIIPGDKIISSKINEMKQLLDNQKIEQQQKLAKAQVVNDLLKKANDLYKLSNWNEAKLAYEKVLQEDQSNAVALKKQQECLDNLTKKTATEEEEAYQSIVSKANENFEKNDFKNAKKLYDRALKLRPSDKFVIAQLNKLNKRNKPAPPVAKPPVEIPVKKEPEPLADLGVKSELSLQDAQAKLEAADKARKNKKSSNLMEELKGVQTNDGDLLQNQQNSITTTKSAINDIVIAADVPEDTSDVSRHLNRALVDSIYGYQQNISTNSQQVERSELYYQKEQLELAKQTVGDQNGLLDGKGLANEKIIRQERVVRENVTFQNDETEVNQNEHTTQDFMTIRLKNEQRAIDESGEKAEFTQQITKVKVAGENAQSVTQGQQQQALYSTKVVLDEASVVVATKQFEDSKLPAVNNNSITQAEKRLVDQQGEDQQNRQNYLQGIKGDLNKEAGVITKYDESMTEKRLDNATTLATEKKELTAKSDSDQTESHEKSIGNKTSINSAKIDIIPDTLSAAATVRLVNELVNNEQTNTSSAQASQTAKQQGNKKTIDGSLNAQEKTAAGLNDAENIEQLKTVSKDLENNAGIQQTAAQVKRLESKKVLDALYKKEAKFTDKLANDLGAIYPEGVSQDQFEILGHDGLVSGIATRRIVVKKNGRGAVYVRTQSMTAITYSKNGQACTELVWQRETQDALLKRNY